MSLTGTPLIITAVLRWLKPRTFTRASPAPPPWFVEYTLGVTLSTSGRSRDPSWFWIWGLPTSVKATADSLSLARSAKTSMALSATASVDMSKLSAAVCPAATSTAMGAVEYPMATTVTSYRPGRMLMTL